MSAITKVNVYKYWEVLYLFEVIEAILNITGVFVYLIYMTWQHSIQIQYTITVSLNTTKFYCTVILYNV
jgi:hypothetical protein